MDGYVFSLSMLLIAYRQYYIILVLLGTTLRMSHLVISGIVSAFKTEEITILQPLVALSEEVVSTTFKRYFPGIKLSPHVCKRYAARARFFFDFLLGGFLDHTKTKKLTSARPEVIESISDHASVQSS